MARARFCQGAAPLGRRQNHPRRSGWYAGPLQGKPAEIRSALEGLCARKHRLDAADARGNAPVPPRPPEHRSVRSRPIAPSRGPLLARLGGGPDLLLRAAHLVFRGLLANRPCLLADTSPILLFRPSGTISGILYAQGLPSLSVQKPLGLIQ